MGVSAISTGSARARLPEEVLIVSASRGAARRGHHYSNCKFLMEKRWPGIYYPCCD